MSESWEVRRQVRGSYYHAVGSRCVCDSSVVYQGVLHDLRWVHSTCQCAHESAPPSSDTTRPPLLHNPTVSSPLCTRPGTFLSSSTGPVVPSRGVRPQCRARLRVSTVSSNKRTFDALSRIPVRDSRFHLYPNTLLLTPRPLGPPTTLSVPGPT